jgi:signal transduction histidine kinase
VNRLWVRLSLMISGVLVFVFFLQFLNITFEQTHTIPRREFTDPPTDSSTEIQDRFLRFVLFSIAIGAVGGVAIGRITSAPITRITKAAWRLGKGELDVRVPVAGSQEIRELAETFNTMADELQHAETLRNNLMADVSHELRTPLTVLEANLRAVLDNVVALDPAEVSNLYGQTRHLIRIVNDLRELALAESARLPLEKVPTDMSALIAETIQAIEPLLVEKEVDLLNNVLPLPKMMVVDPFRIRQVFINLLSNALRHTPPGGTITLTGETNSGMVLFSIRDSGEGLEPEQLSVVFERFYRADKSRSRVTGGSGLGLAIVKAITEAHGGQVKAQSAGKNQGSVFTVWLPLP